MLGALITTPKSFSYCYCYVYRSLAGAGLTILIVGLRGMAPLGVRGGSLERGLITFYYYVLLTMERPLLAKISPPPKFLDLYTRGFINLLLILLYLKSF